MSHLSKLKIVAPAATRQQTKSEHRRTKLLEKLEDQLDMVSARLAGQPFVRHRRIWRTDETGERLLVERVKRTRPWYWMTGAGWFFSVWYGSKMAELKPGMTAIQVTKREELPDAIRAIMEAVKQGVLDIHIEDVAEQGTADLRLKVPLKLVKKAS